MDTFMTTFNSRDVNAWAGSLNFPHVRFAGNRAGEDARFIDQFLERLLAQDEEGRFDHESEFSIKSFRGQIHAFRKGFTGE